MNSATAVVHIVDDDPSVLTALSRLLRAAGFSVKTFDSAAELLSALTPGVRGCVIADLQMPGINGLELQEALAAQGNQIPVIVLTGAGDIPSTVRAMKRGAEDFLSKTAPRKQLIDAINRALARDARQHAERDRLNQLQAPFNTLTPRDCEVLAHLLRGQMNKHIARNLGIDERSVKRHRTSIMAKLQVESVAQLTYLVHAAGLQDAAKGQPHVLDAVHRP